MKRARRWWSIYVACTLLVAGVLIGISALVLQMESADARNRTDAEYQEALRLAMWRMDSWLAPHLAREADRHPIEYLPYYPKNRAWTAEFTLHDPGSVVVPSPLIDFRSEFLTLHFQWTGQTGLTSPQVLSEILPGASKEPADAGIAARRAEALARLGTMVDPEQLRSHLAGGPPAGPGTILVSQQASFLDSLSERDPGVKQARKNQAEYQARVSCAVDMSSCSTCGSAASAGLTLADPSFPVTVGPLIPVWLGQLSRPEELTLVLARRVQAGGLGGTEAIQGVLADRAGLTGLLLSQVHNLFPEARLEPFVSGGGDPDALERNMAMLPFSLHTDPPPAPSVPWMTTTRAMLALGWLTTLVSLGAVGLMLSRIIEFGARRDRFVSAVTHELRTPLTTFQMYASMLDEGMVRDDAQRKTYLKTLRDESSRLSAMVENVLAFARLEQGKPAQRRREELAVGELFTRIEPALRRRAESAEMDLQMSTGPADDATVQIDVEPVGQILFNLVDNACKYASEAADSTIHVEARLENGRLHLRVRDHGPGVPAGNGVSIFDAFEQGEQGGRDATNGASGIGLGLAISRSLARDLGGDLTIEKSVNGGASFLLQLPATGPASPAR